MRQSVCIAFAVSLAAQASGQQTSVVRSPHDLSAGGPGPVRAASESEVCIFCHAPHNASPIRPLWNRAMPAEAYSIYSSLSLDAAPGQPTGASKMCLSCHDGTIALGAVTSREGPILMSGGAATLPTGPSRIGTDLRDDHPISFRFDSALAARDVHLRSPIALPEGVSLDAHGELQCTSCHEPHNNRFGQFLVVQNQNSELCNACHAMGTTTVTAHAQCTACHQPHTAPSGPYLLRGSTVGETCLRCHDGTQMGAKDIRSDLRKASIHETFGPVDDADPSHTQASCTSCHEPHTMGRGDSGPPLIQPSLGQVAGVNLSGAAMRTASSEHDVCFGCHANRTNIEPFIPRQIAQNNTRMEFNPSAVSFHPVTTPGRNPFVPSLIAGWTEASLMRCTDCHSSDTGSKGGGFGASGPHGSNFEPLLAKRYRTEDYTSESPAAYALCYHCHDRTNILSNASFPGHRSHIQDYRTPCAACHDAHGISSSQGNPVNNSHLMNFATNIVRPDPVSGRLEYRDLGMQRSECFLSCHGTAHSPMGYGAPSGLLRPAGPR